MSEIKEHSPIAGLVALVFGLGLWIGETWAFGWNEWAQSHTEQTLDALSSAFIASGIGYIIGSARAMRVVKEAPSENSRD